MYIKKIFAALLLPLQVLLSTTIIFQASPAQALYLTGRGPLAPFLRVDTRLAPSIGAQVTVSAGDDLQAAIDRADPGDVITLEAGATFTGNFTLPEKRASSAGGSQAEWITIRTSAPDAELPVPGTRISPAHSPLLAKIISPNSDAALKTKPGAHHYRFIGIEFSIAAAVKLNYGIVRLGDGNETELASIPSNIIIDRCYIHGHARLDVSRGVALNSTHSAVIDSYISECHGIGFDTQAIAAWGSPGPLKIVNNYLEGAGENVLFGGADPKIRDLVPSDIEFRRNHCYKPLSWRDGILARPLVHELAGQYSPEGRLVAGTTYYYSVAARARVGQSVTATSAASDETTVTLGHGENAARLKWDVPDDVEEFRVYRSSDDPAAPIRSWVYFDVSRELASQEGEGFSFEDAGEAGEPLSETPPVRGTRWTVKNIFELKNARRVLVDGNIFENNWLDAQNGTAILFTVRNQEGTAPWSVIEDVTFTNNIVRHTAAAINILGRDNNHPSEQVKFIEIENNLFDDVDGGKWGGNGAFLTITDSLGVKVNHNTVIHSGNIISAYGPQNKEFTFTNNITAHNLYGVIGDSTAPGLATLDRFFSELSFKKNLIAGASILSYPLKKNFYPATLDEVGFVDRARGNYRLAATSLYKNAGTKERDLGANLDAIAAATGAQ